jgi:hypothetical protein
MALYLYDCNRGHVTQQMMTIAIGDHSRTMPCTFLYGTCEERGHPVDGTHQHTMSVCQETATRRDAY